MKKTGVILIVLAGLICGCAKKQDPRINLREGVGSDTLGSNIVTKPVMHAFSALMGDGIEATEAVTRRNDAGFLELYVTGYNKIIRYKAIQIQSRMAGRGRDFD